MENMMELKEREIHCHQIPGHPWGAVRKPSKVKEEGQMVDADTKEKEINKKGMSRLTIGGGEAIRPK